jgi:dephospho-CoA kinase
VDSAGWLWGCLSVGHYGANELSRARPKLKTPIIGLAGGIGSGKTAVAEILGSLGAAVIDFDRLAHEGLCAPGVAATLCEWWGKGVRTPDGRVDRRAIAAIVFENPGELARLEKLLYPGVVRRSRELIARFTADPAVKAVVLDAPKLLEAGLDELCDELIFVEADWSVRVQRVKESRGWTEEDLRRRENLQNPLDIKKASADHVVINHSGIDALQSQVERLFSSVLASYA